MLGAHIKNLAQRLESLLKRDPRLLTPRQFGREVMRERIRSTRRSIPFCLITIDLVGDRTASRTRTVSRLLHRNLRITDHKGGLARGRFAVLLVDTPEMGGRVVLDRLQQLMGRIGLSADLHLRVHDPDGFSDDDRGVGGGRRVTDLPTAKWTRVSGGEVEVTTEDPLVQLPLARMTLKRSIDIAGAVVGLTAASPILLASMVAIRITSPGPVLFRQTREGRGGKPFTIYKLRTMVDGAETFQHELRVMSHRDGPAFKVRCDPRVTPVGRILRATCVDELPQFWNVLRGDMSLVGPRPLPWHESRACHRWHRRRLDVRPGMTCYWQVNKAQAKSFDDWMRMDLRYVDQFDLIKDLGLIAQTFTVPVTGRGSE